MKCYGDSVVFNIFYGLGGIKHPKFSADSPPLKFCIPKRDWRDSGLIHTQRRLKSPMNLRPMFWTVAGNPPYALKVHANSTQARPSWDSKYEPESQILFTGVIFGHSI